MLTRRALLGAGLVAWPAGVALAAQEAAQRAAPATDNLSFTLQQQTQALMDAVAAGDKGPWQRLLSDDIVFVDESGARKTKAELVNDLRPLPPQVWGSIRVTGFDIVRHGNVVVSTWVADETEGYFGQVIYARYKNTDTWLLAEGTWQLIASQVQALRDDPPAIEPSVSALNAYVGRYTLTPEITYTITREGTTLKGQRTGREPETLKVEVENVLFVPGQPRLRKIFKRDQYGKVSGFVERRETWDIAWSKSL